MVVTYGASPQTLAGVDFLSPGWVSDGDEVYVAFEPHGAATLFPVERPPERQGGLHVPGHGPAGPRRGGQRAAQRDHAGRRRHHLGLRRPRRDGDLPRADRHRRPRLRGVGRAERSPDPPRLRRGRRRTRRRADGADRGDDRPLRRPVRARTRSSPTARSWSTSLSGTPSRRRPCRSSAPTPPPARRSSPTNWPTNGSATPSAPPRWQDIWLNEGFATYAELLWQEHRGVGGPDEFADAYRGGSSLLDLPPADPGRDELFAPRSTTAGALTLYVLDETVGRETFLEILRTWIERLRRLVGVQRRLRGAGRGGLGPGADPDVRRLAAGARDALARRVGGVTGPAVVPRRQEGETFTPMRPVKSMRFSNICGLRSAKNSSTAARAPCQWP